MEGAALPRARGDRSEGGGTPKGVKEVYHPAGGRAGRGDGGSRASKLQSVEQ